MIKLIINNIEEDIEQNIKSIDELLKYKNFTFKMLVIKRNGELVKKEDYSNTIIQNGDKIDIIHLISGG